MAYAQKSDFVFRRNGRVYLTPLNAELNPICYLLALLGAHHILHISGLRVKSAGRGGRQFSRLLVAELCASEVVMLDTTCSEVVWRLLDTTPFASFPFSYPPIRHRVPSRFNWTLIIQRVSFIAVLSTASCPASVTADAGYLWDRRTVFGVAIKKTPYFSGNLCCKWHKSLFVLR
jgi:hypothetical protein